MGGHLCLLLSDWSTETQGNPALLRDLTLKIGCDVMKRYSHVLTLNINVSTIVLQYFQFAITLVFFF